MQRTRTHLHPPCTKRPTVLTSPLASLLSPAQDAAKAGVGPNASAASPQEPPVQLSARAVASLLLGQALALRSKDDITVSVLELGPHLRAQQ